MVDPGNGGPEPFKVSNIKRMFQVSGISYCRIIQSPCITFSVSGCSMFLVADLFIINSVFDLW